MKQLQTILLIFIGCNQAWGQVSDTLEFKNGNIVPATIIDVDDDNRVIHYKKNGTNSIASFTVVIGYYYQGEWHQLENTAPPIHVRKSVAGNFFIDPLELGEAKWRVYTNILGMFNNGYGRNRFQELKQFSLEPEYIMGQWAFKFPFKFGIDNQQYDVMKAYDYVGPAWDNATHEINHWVDRKVPKDAPYLGLPEYIEDDWYWNHRMGHYAKSHFQIGINPKFYLQKHRRKKRSAYLSAAFSYGIGDFGAVTSYETLDYKDEYSWRDYYYRVWSMKHREYVVSQNLFDYFRHEYMLGVELNFLKNWCLNAEIGWTSPLRNKGQLEDIVYARYGNRPYEEVLRYHYNPSMHVVATGNILIGYYFR